MQIRVLGKFLLLPFAVLIAAVTIPALTAWHFLFDKEEFDAKG